MSTLSLEAVLELRLRNLRICLILFIVFINYSIVGTGENFDNLQLIFIKFLFVLKLLKACFSCQTMNGLGFIISRIIVFFSVPICVDCVGDTHNRYIRVNALLFAS